MEIVAEEVSNFRFIENCFDINKCCNDLNEFIVKTLHSHLPHKTCNFLVKSSEKWMTNDILQLMKQRDRAKALLKYSCDPFLYNDYSHLRNSVNLLIRNRKSEFIRQKIIECKGETNKLWKVLGSIVNTKKYIKHKTSEQTNTISANELNEFFISEPKRIVRNLEIVSEELPEDNFTTNSENQTFSIPLITEENINKIIDESETHKSSGSDSIPMKFIKTFKFSLIPFLLFLMNLSIITSCVPTAWRISRVTAIHKNGSKEDPNNFRPISNIPIFARILEKHVQKSLYNFVTKNKLLSDKQFAFRKNFSTIDAIVYIINIVTTALNINLKVGLISLDLKKAFDTVDHKILLKKLKKIGCDEMSTKWFESYLRTRYQFVRKKGSVSKIEVVETNSIPQGSALGPLLFSIFINDITKLKLNGLIVLYADDMTLLVSAKNYDELQSRMNSDLKSICSWLKNNKLALNEDKSYFMIMGQPRNSIDISVKTGLKAIKRVSNIKILGVLIDHKLHFEEHINELSTNISKKLNFFTRLRHYVPQSTAKVAFEALIFPLIDYCSIAYGFTYKTHVNRIEVLIRRAARIITFSGFTASHVPLFQQLNWKSFQERLRISSLKYIFKSLHGMAADTSSGLFIYMNHTRSRRFDNSMLELPNIKSNFLQNTIFYKGVKLWNDLPLNIRQLTKFNQFCSSI